MVQLTWPGGDSCRWSGWEMLRPTAWWTYAPVRCRIRPAKNSSREREVSFFDRAMTYVDGAVTWVEMFGPGGHPVPAEQAQKRADICTGRRSGAACPLNQPGPVVIEKVANAIKRSLGLLKHLGLRVHGQRRLRTCMACSCPLAGKVWFDIDLIAPDAEERARLHPSCWLLAETK